MRYAILLQDIAESVLEASDWMVPEVHASELYSDLLRIASTSIERRRIDRIISISICIYLTVSAIREGSDYCDMTSEIIHRAIEHHINEAYVRTSDGTPYYVEPIMSYLDTNPRETSRTIAHDLYTLIDDAFLNTEVFDSEPYQYIVTHLNEIPDDAQLFEYSHSHEFRYQLYVLPSGLIDGMMVVLNE